MRLIERLVVGLSRGMAVIATMATVVLMIAIVVDVSVRFVTGRSVPAMLEISESALVVAIFFALAWAGVAGAHVSVTLVSDRVGPRTARAFDIAGWLLGSVLIGWFVLASALRAHSATLLGETRMGLVQWPIWPLRWVIVAGFAALLLVCLVNLARALGGRPLLSDERESQEPGEAQATPPAQI